MFQIKICNWVNFLIDTFQVYEVLLNFFLSIPKIKITAFFFVRLWNPRSFHIKYNSSSTLDCTLSNLQVHLSTSHCISSITRPASSKWDTSSDRINTFHFFMRLKTVFRVIEIIKIPLTWHTQSSVFIKKRRLLCDWNKWLATVDRLKARRAFKNRSGDAMLLVWSNYVMHSKWFIEARYDFSNIFSETIYWSKRKRDSMSNWNTIWRGGPSLCAAEFNFLHENE